MLLATSVTCQLAWLDYPGVTVIRFSAMRLLEESQWRSDPAKCVGPSGGREGEGDEGEAPEERRGPGWCGARGEGGRVRERG